MTDFAARRLEDVYGIAPSKIDKVPHGTPDLVFQDSRARKESLGRADQSIILTFGLLGRHKGVEVAIDAMPKILASLPDAVFMIVGPTHPDELMSSGESYRAELKARADALGVGERVVFDDRFVVGNVLADAVQACDVLITPYVHDLQGISGTVSYGLAAGKAIVSTPFPYAKEMLGDGGGVLVPFADSDALSASIVGLLADPALRLAYRRRSYEIGREFLWPTIAKRYMASLRKASARFQ